MSAKQSIPVSIAAEKAVLRARTLLDSGQLDATSTRQGEVASI